jgi:hypothetical protein
MQKLSLYFSIKKFYKIFGFAVGANFITKLSKMTDDNLNDVIYDINEILCGYEDDETDEMYIWLDRLVNEIAWFRQAHYV